MAKIELNDVSVTFRVRPQGRIGLKEFLVRHVFRRSANPAMNIHALRDIRLRIGEGERIGVIGQNGAGKTTLLKLLAGVYPPTRGHRTVEGRVSSLFDISLGFEMKATGWQNIAYRCYLQGETPKSLRGKLGAIAEFSELGRFLDLPVRCYSAGMLVRLAFSVATAIEPEILLVDEVLSAGDLAFQRKARKRMREMMAKARLLVLVSHDLPAIPEVCGTVIWLERGRIRQIGPAARVIAEYTAAMEDTVELTPGPLSAADRLSLAV
jgi:ABC-type polysaccharide/polyol phosphate transport system ATPase subunit